MMLLSINSLLGQSLIDSSQKCDEMHRSQSRQSNYSLSVLQSNKWEKLEEDEQQAH